MILNRKHAEWLVIALFGGLVALVFQQIATSMTEQGIASGSPYDNAAAYPRAVAILIAILVAAQAAMTARRGNKAPGDAGQAASGGRGALVLVAIFAAYLLGLSLVGYHIATVLMVALVMFAGGERNPLSLAVFPVGLSLVVSYFFEAQLKVVLPGGVLGLIIPW